jgi:enoyl-CoA hydratase/carnithine racemase
MSVVQIENREGALWVTLNRPQHYNSMSPEVMCRLMDMWIDAQNDDSVRCVVLTGAGDKAFCSGADLKQTIPLLSGARAPENEYDHRLKDTSDWLTQLMQRNATFTKPVIAVINGTAMAGGCELALASDIRIASTNASFALSEPKVGVIPAGGSIVRLPRQIPWCHAMEFMLTGDTISAERAKEIGLVNRVVEPENLYTEAEKIVATIKANAPLSIQAIKRAATLSSGKSLDEAFALEDKEADFIITTEDAREGPRAFAEKRKPVFKGC